MSRQGRKSILVIVRAALAAAAVAFYSTDVPTQSAPYRIIDLGMPGGASAGYGIEELGQAIAGQTKTADGTYHAFIMGRAGLRDLDTLGRSSSMAFAIGGGSAVGQARTALGQDHAFSATIYSAGPMVDLGTLGGTWSAAYGAQYGMVVGASKTTGEARTRAFVYTNGAMSPLALDWGGDSVARAIAGGLIVGQACTAGNARCTAFSFRDGVVTKLDPLGSNSVANAVSNSDQIAGTYTLAGQNTTHAFRFANGALVDLDTLGGASASSKGFGINARGDVVGTSDTTGSGQHAFLWRNGAGGDGAADPREDSHALTQPATGGTTVSGSVTLECAAPAGGIVVSLSSGNAAIASPTATSVTVPAGATAASFSVRTTSPAAATSVSMYATVHGVRKRAALTVNP